MKKIITKASGLVIACTTPLAMGFTFETETLNGSFDSTITAGMGLRTESRGCNLINQGPTGHNAPSGCLAQSSGVADQGDLNYDRGDMFTNYLKGTHELLLKMPEDITFMARGTWIRDFAATDTTGTLSFNTPESVGSNGLSDDARDDLAFKARLLDLWVSKGFDVGGQRVRARLGNAESRAEVTRAASAAIARTTSRGVIMLILAEVPKRSMVPYRVITPARAPSDNVNMRRR